MMCKSLSVLIVLLLAASVEARYCNSSWCKMCNEKFGPLPGYQLTANFDSIRIVQRVHIASTPHEVVRVMVDELKLGPGDVLYDLGCGDARTLIDAVRRYGCKGVGIEKDPRVAAIARDAVRRSGVGDRIRIVTGDVMSYRYSLERVDAIFVYLNPPLLAKLMPRIETRRIVSYQHELPGLDCRTIETPGGGLIYCAVVSGGWF